MKPPLPDTSREDALRAAGFARVAGVDEAGRGCLAGPVVAAAVVLPPGAVLPGVADSKLLSPAARDEARAVIEAVATAIGVGMCTADEVDRLNVLRAALLAMRRAVEALPAPPAFVLIDGNRPIPGAPWPVETLVGGDRRCLSIAAASVVAKTTRDRLMTALDADFPAYGWRRNAGYPTRDHYAALAAHGPTPHHRRTFRLA